MGENDLATFVANKDKTISIKDADGREVRYTKESDLLAIKGGAEVAEKRLKEVETTHQAEVSAVRVELSEAHSRLLQAEAAKEQLEEKLTQSAGSAEELAGIKQKLADADKNAEALSNKVLESRRQLLVAIFGVPLETVKDKTEIQLDAYEEALKAVRGSKGIGSYAIAGGGGTGPTTERPLDRARRILEEAEAKGHVYGGGGSSFGKGKD